MAEYYFDIETLTPSERPDPKQDTIITIQYQRLSTKDGSPETDLSILTEWGLGSEKAILERFRPLFLTGRDFDFIPIGVNLHGYDLLVLLNRLNHYFGLGLDMSFFRTRPVLDLKPTLVMMNEGKFSGYQDLLGKDVKGSVVKGWYQARDHVAIEDYVRKEAANFISKYQFLKKQLGSLSFPS